MSNIAWLLRLGGTEKTVASVFRGVETEYIPTKRTRSDLCEASLEELIEEVSLRRLKERPRDQMKISLVVPSQLLEEGSLLALRYGLGLELSTHFHYDAWGLGWYEVGGRIVLYNPGG